MIAGTLGVIYTLTLLAAVPDRRPAPRPDPATFAYSDAVVTAVNANSDIFPWFLAAFLFVFAASGIGNGSTYRMIPLILANEATTERDRRTASTRRMAKATKESSAVIGIAGAIGALGGFLIPMTFGAPWIEDPVSAVKVAFGVFTGFYVVCLATTWFVYVRTGQLRRPRSVVWRVQASDDHHALSLLLAAVRHAADRSRARPSSRRGTSSRSTAVRCAARDGALLVCTPGVSGSRRRCCATGRRGSSRRSAGTRRSTRSPTRLLALRAEHGPDTVGVFGGGGLTNEKAYQLGKFARVALGTSQIDYNGRWCMSSAASAGTRAFGLDRGLPFPLADIEEADVVVLVGSNMAETMPPAARHLDALRERGGQVVVIDPRRTATADRADVFVQPVPGSDLALALGVLHLLVAGGLVDDVVRRRADDRVGGRCATRSARGGRSGSNA